MSNTSAPELMSVLIASSLDCIICTDRNGHILEFNPAAEQTFGWTRAEVLGRRFYELIVPPAMRDIHVLLMAGFRPGQASTIVGRRQELPVVNRAGLQFIVELAITTVEYGGEHLFVAYLRDITSRRQAEQELQDACHRAEAASRAKSAFVAAMSHEVRTPLSALVGALQLLEDSALDREALRLVRIGQQSADLLTALVDEVLDFAKIEAGHLEVELVDFEPCRLLDSVVHVLASRVRQYRVELAIELDPAVPRWVRMGRNPLRQILLNLIGNAIKAAPEGEVLLRLEMAAPNWLQFAVADNGPGLSLEKQQLVFDEFADFNPGRLNGASGIGLGLAVCKRLVDCLGGRIRVASVPGQGCQFSVELPYLPANEVDGSASSLAGPDGDLAGRRVLLLADGFLAKHVGQQYAGWGAQVQHAATVAEALECLKAAKGAPYHLLLCDFRAEHLSGPLPLLLQRCRADAVPVAAVQNGGMHLAERSPAPGVDYWLTTPLLLNDLQHCLLPAGATRSAAPLARPRPQFQPLYGQQTAQRLRVLLAEDSQSNRLVLAELLRRRGCEVEVVTNGLEAVDSARTLGHDVVLMDIDMPEMDGVTALRMIRDGGVLAARLPVIAMTAHAAREARAEFLAAGFDDYLSKPIDGDELFSTVFRWGRGETAVATAASLSGVHSANSARDGAHTGQVLNILNRAVLQRLGLAVGTERLPRMIRIFCSELERRAALIQEALAPQDLLAIRRESHVIKGSAATFGAHELQANAARLDEACRLHDRQAAVEHARQLLLVITPTLFALRAELGQE